MQNAQFAGVGAAEQFAAPRLPRVEVCEPVPAALAAFGRPALDDLILQAIPDAEFHAIDGAAHLPILEQAARTDSIVLEFLRRH